MTGLPKDVLANPRLSAWLSVGADGTVALRIGKVELGQGILTALVQIAADELDVDPAAITMLAAHTGLGPDEGPTAGSMSVADAGAAVRQVCAQVRRLFLDAASAALEVDPADLRVDDGRISTVDGARSLTYGELAAAVDLDRDAGPPVETKPYDQLRLTGTSLPRIDLPDKVTGVPRFLSDLALPGQLWGRVVRPPSPGAALVAVDAAAGQAPGVVAVVRDGSFLGVVAETERAADLAVAGLRAAAEWREEATLPDEDDLAGYLRAGPHDDLPVDEAGTPGSGVVTSLTATYSRPFLAHASMSPSCGAARWDGDRLHVWSSSQSVFGLRTGICLALGLEPGGVVVEHVEGAGSYGHNAADDAAFDAVLLARSVPGRPVHVRWSRQDELSWAPFGSAQAVDVTAGLDSAGRIVSWEADVWSQGHTSRPGFRGTPALLAAAHLAEPHPLAAPGDPPPERGAGSTRNARPGYAIAARRITGHRLREVALRSSSLRTLGAHANVFAIESMVDELAQAAGADPLEFRLAHLDDERGRAVLLAAAERAGWSGRASDGDVGWGLGYARYKDKGAWCAVVAEVETGTELRVRRLTLAVDVGRVVSPDGVRNQIEGGAVQSASWTMAERVRFDHTRITSTDWESYPILRFRQAPRVDVVLLDRPEEPSLGAGEAAQGPTAGALGNAVAAALGIRVRDLPITAERVVSAIQSGDSP
ncbi:molybdopterin-dependent oxidoreductase [Blastococcus jejuensis]|uniref:Molybdopterin-dependent oxidoreductase n=1 Tax=Blastococcus jejuensis TaxID=351224 RepID=A0ABP6P8Q1_9ACTN